MTRHCYGPRVFGIRMSATRRVHSIRAAIRNRIGRSGHRHNDFGRRLAQRQGIEILGPSRCGRTAATVGDGDLLNTFMAAYSLVIAI